MNKLTQFIVLVIFFSINGLSYAKQNDSQSSLNISPNDLKIGEEHTAQLNDTVVRFKRVSPVSNNKPSPKVNAKLEKLRAIREEARQAPDKQSLFIYNPEFAKRFKLDLNQAEILGDGLYAIELIIEKEKGSDTFWSDYPNYDNLFEKLPRGGEDIIPHNREAINLVAPHGKSPNSPFNFNCYLNLYLDSHLPIDYAFESKIMENNCALDRHCNIDKHGSTPHEILKNVVAPIYKQPGFVWPPDKAFGKYNTDYQDEFGMYQHSEKNDMDYKVYLSSKLKSTLFGFRPTYYSAIIRQYKKEFVTGINYISLGPFFSCDKISHALPQGYLLLEKKGRPYYGPYFDTDYLNLNDFYYYKLPQRLMEWRALQMAVKREENSFYLDLKNNVFYMNDH